MATYNSTVDSYTITAPPIYNNLTQAIMAANAQIQHLQTQVTHLQAANRMLTHELTTTQSAHRELQSELSFAMQSNSEQAATMAAQGTQTSTEHCLAGTQLELDRLRAKHALAFDMLVERTVRLGQMQEAEEGVYQQLDDYSDLLASVEGEKRALEVRLRESKAREQVLLMRLSPMNFSAETQVSAESVDRLRKVNWLLMEELRLCERGVRGEVEEALRFYAQHAEGLEFVD